MLVSELIGSKVIVKCIVRNESGYIGSIEIFGEIIKTGQTITVLIKEGELTGKNWVINVKDAQFSEPDDHSYALGGTGKWSSQRIVYVNDVDFLIEWYVEHSKFGDEPDIKEEKTDRLPELPEGKENKEPKKKTGHALPLIPKNVYENKPDAIKAQWSTNIEDNPVTKGMYGVVRYDSERGYNKVSRVSKDDYATEEEANQVMVDAAREFAALVRRGGHLIDIKRLSRNSVRVEYVSNNGGASFVIFQIFEG